MRRCEALALVARGIGFAFRLAAGGAGIAVWQYFEAKQTARVKRTVGFLQRFEDSPALAEARRCGCAPTRSRSSNRTPLSQHQATAVRERLTQALLRQSPSDLRPDLDTLLQFYDTLRVCVDQALCDRATAAVFFGAYAADLWDNFQPYLQARCAAIPDYGAALEAFALTQRRVPQQ